MFVEQNQTLNKYLLNKLLNNLFVVDQNQFVEQKLVIC